MRAMQGTRPKLYTAALLGLVVFGALVVMDMLRPGLLPGGVSLLISLGLAVSGIGVLVLRPRGKRVRPHEAPPSDFTAVLDERRRLAEDAARRPPRLPPQGEQGES